MVGGAVVGVAVVGAVVVVGAHCPQGTGDLVGAIVAVAKGAVVDIKIVVG